MYRVEVERRAAKDAERFPAHDLRRILTEIEALKENPRPSGSKKLTEMEGYRIRVGDYRILYYVDDSAALVTVYRIKRRSEGTYR